MAKSIIRFDPLERGYIASLARPGGNITGLVFQQLELAQKQVVWLGFSLVLAVAAISSEEAESRKAKAAEARAELDTARLDLEHTQVRAPISGRVSRALVTTGNLVSGAPGVESAG